MTIHVDDYLSAVPANAKDFGVAVTGATRRPARGPSRIQGATADAAGALTDDVMVAVTLDESGKIVGAVIDTAQVDQWIRGAITSDLSRNRAKWNWATIRHEEGFRHRQEWYEQAAALAQWMIGKTVDEVAGMKLSDEGTLGSGPDSTVTIHVGDYIKALQRRLRTPTDPAQAETSNPPLALGIFIARHISSRVQSGLQFGCFALREGARPVSGTAIEWREKNEKDCCAADGVCPAVGLLTGCAPKPI